MKTLNDWILIAHTIAKYAHYGQYRRDGVTPYITHPEIVAANVGDRLKPIALLHDVIEDAPDRVSMDLLKSFGFPLYITDAIDLLTKKEGMTYEYYITCILQNSDAVHVKIADIKHNLSCSPSLGAVAKYNHALKVFRNHGYEE